MTAVEIPVPERLKRFPFHNGFLVHYTVFRHPDGTPDFRVIDTARQAEAVGKNLCHLCGQRLTKPFVFIGGPKSVANRNFTDGPMHEECARYAAAVCPFLAMTARKLSDPSKVTVRPGRAEPEAKTLIVSHGELVEDSRPAKMGFARTDSYEAVKRGGLTVFFAGPWISVDWNVMPQRE